MAAGYRNNFHSFLSKFFPKKPISSLGFMRIFFIQVKDLNDGKSPVPTLLFNLSYWDMSIFLFGKLCS